MGKKAARVGDAHTCAADKHGGGPVKTGAEHVHTNSKLQARTLDELVCEGAKPDVIATGSMTVLVNSRPAARLSDLTHVHFNDTGGAKAGCGKRVSAAHFEKAMENNDLGPGPSPAAVITDPIWHRPPAPIPEK